MIPPSECSIRVLIVDDHFFTRIGLTAALNMEPDIGVVAEATCGRDAITLYAAHRPDVTLLDGQLPDIHGAEVTREILAQDTQARLIIFSIEETEEDIHRAVAAGVYGYLQKNAPRGELLTAVRTVAAGRRFFPNTVNDKLQARLTHAPLSPREIEVLKSMAKGRPNKVIATEMNVSTETVKTFVSRILDKLAVEDRTQAVMVALKRGLLKRK